MEAYAEIKKQKSQIKRRAKLIKTGWRNGICGVEMPDNDKSSVLYESNQSAILAYQARQERRMDILRQRNGASEQIGFFSSQRI